MSHTVVRILSPAALRAKHVGYVLPNGVRCVIVQDTDAKKPAAAMSIAAGQLNDPPAVPGLAHFCEHMLFMGTEKFPKEDEYDSFISKSNGFNNAFTADQATVYYFEVSDAALDGALERFVEFFVAPTFDESAVNREVRAVHSEDEKNHSSDYWRRDEVFRGMYHDRHPRSRYGNGNETTLVEEPKKKGLILREELKKFYAAHYAAGGACIVVYSARDPESVMRLIEAPLLRMRPGKGPSFHFAPAGEGLFKPAVLGSWMNIKTIKKDRSILVQWPVRSASSLWKSVPSAYISHILGHECDSSVLGVLKRRDWATAMVAGGSRRDDDYELFYSIIALTVEGFHHIAEVVGLVYEYVGLAVNGGVDTEVYAQMKAEERLSFECLDIGRPSSHCVDIAQRVHESSLEHCIIASHCILEDDFEASLAYARQLTPDNAQVTLLWGSLPSLVASKASSSPQTAEATEDDSDAKADEDGEGEEQGGASPESLFAALPAFAQRPADTLSRFHKTQYAEVRIPEEQRAVWRAALANPTCPELKLPAANPFVATDFTVFASAGDGEATAETFHCPHGIAIIRKDANHHKTFKCAVSCGLVSPIAYATALHRLYTQVMCSILEDSLTELSYYGELASLSNTLKRDAGGPGFVIVGPYQQLPAFFARVLDHTLNTTALKGTREKFDTYREQFIRDMEGRASSQPYEHAVERVTKTACFVQYTYEDLLAVAPSAVYDDYSAFVDRLFCSGLLFECFIAGNMPSERAVMDSIVSVVERKLTDMDVPIPDRSAVTPFRDSLDLSPPSTASHANATVASVLDVVSFPPFHLEDPNVAAVLNVFIGSVDARTAALGRVAANMYSSLFFNALRTKESLGYIVFAQYSPLLQGHSLRFVAQSAVAGVDGVYLLSRIVAFLSALEDSFERLCTHEELHKVTEGLIQGLENPPNSVKMDVSMLQQDYMCPMGLGRRKELVKALKALTVEDVSTFFKQYVFNSRANARGLVIVVNSGLTVSTDILSLPPGSRSREAKVVSLPPRQKAPEESTHGSGVAAPPSGEGELSLPSFDSATAEPTRIEVTLFDSLEEYKRGRPVLHGKTL